VGFGPWKHPIDVADVRCFAPRLPSDVYELKQFSLSGTPGNFG
jgi:hypothetical protein